MSRLIFAHDLHGIDINATQIAALALWLPCQRADREMELEQDRPGITRSNIVCAEPMPGEKSLLDEFLKTLKENRLENLMRRVMQIPVRLVWGSRGMAGTTDWTPFATPCLSCMQRGKPIEPLIVLG